MTTPLDLEERTRRSFRRFAAEITPGESDLYRRLTAGIAADDELIDLALVAAARRQPPPNMLLGAVHDLLLAGARHGLAAWYPSISGSAPSPPADPMPAFTDFVRGHMFEIRDLLETRFVQTNEVRRCAILVHAYNHLLREHAGPSLALVEVGASAGFNLLFDRYRYDYGHDGVAGADGALTLRATLRGEERPPPLDPFPMVRWRRGMDLHPVDLDDPHQARWLRALVWPDQLARMARVSAAIEIGRRHPSAVIAGDLRTDLVPLLETAPPDVPLAVAHSFTFNQLTPEERAAFDTTLAAAGRHRTLHRVSLEWLGYGPYPRLEITTYRGGPGTTRFLGYGHHHGEWLEWRARRGPDPAIDGTPSPPDQAGTGTSRRPQTQV